MTDATAMTTTDRPVRIALAGIDGSGKSTTARLLADRAPDGARWIVLSCVRPHENPDGPLHALSHQLDRLSAAADRFGRPDLKLVMLCLQMCTYGPTERFHAAELAPDVIVSDRHPLVDALAYLPLYRRAIDAAAAERRRPHLDEVLDRLDPADMRAATAWAAVVARRLGRALDLTALAGELVMLLNLPSVQLRAALENWLMTPLPDAVVFLDIEADVAAHRLLGRGGRTAIHERQEHLARIRRSYESALASLDDVAVYRVSVAAKSRGQVADEVRRIALESCLVHPGRAAEAVC